MLAVLDNGLPADDPCALVPDYACDWWNNDAEPDATQIMSSTNLARLLAVHETHRPISDLQVQSPASSGPEPACNNCHQYRELAAEAVGELDSVLQYAKAMQISAEGNFQADTRRAQGFFLLQEGVQQKEMREKPTAPACPPKQHKGPSTIDGVNVNRKSQRAHAMASAELERLQQMPPASHKWTWGSQLTDAEAIALLVPRREVPQVPHSGYDVSLPEDLRFTPSPTPSMPNLSSSPLSTKGEMPLLPEGNADIDRLAFRTTCSDVQGSDNGSSIYMTDATLAATWGAAAVPEIGHQQGGVNTEAVVGDAEMQDANGGESDTSMRDLAPAFPPETDAVVGDADMHEGHSDDSVTELAQMWCQPAGKLANAENSTHHPEDSVTELAQMGCTPTGKLDDTENDDADNAVMDLAQMWCKPTSKMDDTKHDESDEAVTDLANPVPYRIIRAAENDDSDNAVTDLVQMWCTPTSKMDDTEHDDSDNAVTDLAQMWSKPTGKLQDAENDDSDDAVTDLAQMWCQPAGNLAGLNDANEAQATGLNEAESETEANSHEDSTTEMAVWSDQNTGVTSAPLSRITLPTTQPEFTSMDFDFLDPSWLDSPPQSPPNDSGEEESNEDDDEDESDEDESDEDESDEDESDEDDNAASFR
jgi:hypothetical protein